MLHWYSNYLLVYWPLQHLGQIEDIPWPWVDVYGSMIYDVWVSYIGGFNLILLSIRINNYKNLNKNQTYTCSTSTPPSN